MPTDLLSGLQALVAWLAFIRCAEVAIGVVRQVVRWRRASANKWGWVETLCVPEPVLLVVFTYSFYVGASTSQDTPISPLVSGLLGTVSAVVASCLSHWAFFTIPSLSSGHYVLADQEIVTRGPYTWVRHPMYLGVFLMWLGVGAAYQSFWVLLVTIMYVVPIYVFYAESEEELLVSQFGEPYERYQRSVGMLLPRLARFG